MWQVEDQLGHVNQFLEDRPDELQAELDALHDRTWRWRTRRMTPARST
jgi:hypothetical protein